jgi:hypothetical protein
MIEKIHSLMEKRGKCAKAKASALKCPRSAAGGRGRQFEDSTISERGIPVV